MAVNATLALNAADGLRRVRLLRVAAVLTGNALAFDRGVHLRQAVQFCEAGSLQIDWVIVSV